ncbi:hypothetical protein GGI00_002906 [Coemansia sp. RSA 2681]|nr:hypothetical protein GGI00_002906 [Coemansia sp. RSA 2681]
MASELERLLSQITSESARGVARLAPLQRSPPGLSTVFTGVEALDDALREIYDDDSGGGSSGDAPLLELLGLPGSGKTQVLYHVCTTIALPRSTSGYESHVLLIDIDGKASPRMLAQHMRDRVVRAAAMPASEIEQAIAEALRRVHFFAPSSTQSLIATLAMLPKYVHDKGIAAGALLIDGLGANYWVDRKEAAHIRLRSRRATPFFRLQQLLVDTLQLAHQRLGCLAVAASLLLLPVLDSAPRQASQDSSSGSQGASSQARVIEAQLHEYRDHMIQRWSSVVSRSFVLDSACVDGSRPSEGALTRVTFAPVDSRRQQARQAAASRLFTAYVSQHGLRGSTEVGS